MLFFATFLLSVAFSTQLLPETWPKEFKNPEKDYLSFVTFGENFEQNHVDVLYPILNEWWGRHPNDGRFKARWSKGDYPQEWISDLQPLPGNPKQKMVTMHFYENYYGFVLHSFPCLWKKIQHVQDESSSAYAPMFEKRSWVPKRFCEDLREKLVPYQYAFVGKSFAPFFIPVWENGLFTVYAQECTQSHAYDDIMDDEGEDKDTRDCTQSRAIIFNSFKKLNNHRRKETILRIKLWSTRGTKYIIGASSSLNTQQDDELKKNDVSQKEIEEKLKQSLQSFQTKTKLFLSFRLHSSL